MSVVDGAMMKAQVQQIHFDEDACSLLQESQLLTEDLRDNPDVLLFGCPGGGSLAGVVGLELFGSVALLRSLAVAVDRRDQGVGNALLRHAESAAWAHGVRELYLLTTSAEEYFRKRGYIPAEREVAPPPIRGTRQFSGLCPSSSAFMVKRLD